MNAPVMAPSGALPLAASNWPPPALRLAPRIFPERLDADPTALDRLATAAALNLRRRAIGRRAPQQRLLGAIASHADAMARADDDALRQLARRHAVAAFGPLDPAAAALTLAALAEVARRTLGLRPHPPQLLGTWTMVQGCLLELDTGEGKTLTAALTASFAALAGVPTHVVTVNDYLAQRDAETMAPLFDFLRLSVGVVHSGVAQPDRAAQYARALTYCTNKDLVFDYLRDRVTARGVASQAQMAVRRLHGELRMKEPLRLRGLHFAVVDEADSVLIDEARTPLILSAQRDATADASLYVALLAVAGALRPDEHFLLHPAESFIEFTAAGLRHLRAVAADQLASGGAAEVWRTQWIWEHYLLQALRALHFIRRDEHYVVADGKVVIVDEFTGRMLPDRSWEQGLHQLVEIREGCAPTGGNLTLARITYQAFFGRYLRLAGMSGTIREKAGELAYVFGTACVRIEPNRPSRRVLLAPRLFADQAAKLRAVVDEVRAMLAAGRPVLVGTRSVSSSQMLSAALTDAGLPHRVLNALQNADEAELVAAAGAAGAVTVATNMAGRGTDIRLAPGVAERGGLHVVLTEWHESARIDRQLFGRGARQGDPGSVRCLVALDDDAVQRHGAAQLRWLARRMVGDALPGWLIEALRRHVQNAAERAHGRQRRNTLKQDNQMKSRLAFSGSGE